MQRASYNGQSSCFPDLARDYEVSCFEVLVCRFLHRMGGGRRIPGRAGGRTVEEEMRG